MPQIRQGDNQLTDISFLMELTERDPNFLEAMGLFETDFLTGTLASFERVVNGTDEMYSVARGADRQVAGDDGAVTAAIEVPFFTLDKTAKPHEVQDLREYGTADTPASTARRVERIVQRIRRSHNRLLKKVMYTALKGSTYAVDASGAARPNLTRTFQSMFEIPNSDMFDGAAGGVKAFDLTDQAKNPKEEFELFRQHVVKTVKDGVTGGDNYEIVILMGSSAFSRLAAHSDYIDAVSNYTDGDSLRKRLGGTSNTRVLEWDGISFVEDNSGEIATNQGIIFPRELLEGEIKFAPADAIGYENTVAEEAYIFMEEGTRKVSIESETSVVACIPRCDLIGVYNFTV